MKVAEGAKPFGQGNAGMTESEVRDLSMSTYGESRTLGDRPNLKGEMMKFNDALAQLRHMEPGYCSMRYVIMIHGDGSIVPECSVYTPRHLHTYPARLTWEEALRDLQDKMDGTLPRPLEGAPE